METTKYIIGIDLGTTNSAVSYVDLRDDVVSPQIRIFKIPQLIAQGEISRLSILPSFLYLAGTYDISSDSIALPWAKEQNNIVGVMARDQGAKVPSRLVSSAKSWLCHSRIDRRASILPWGTTKDLRRVSPVEASSAYLKHIRNAWNHRMGNDEESYLENQLVIITVPASFDEVARDLTVEAAKMAGINNVTLLEEPLAAFYSWLNRHEKDWNHFVKPGQLILVCDVGGGTTDFTLISLRESQGSPKFERIAVGEHLILGGDNIDVTLARIIEQRFHSKSNLNTERWQMLCHLCRQAKEEILDGKVDTKIITIVGEGSKLIAGTLKASLEKEELIKIVSDGFFPIFDKPDDFKLDSFKKGMTEFGLPYEQEPSITKHLYRFLYRHQKNVKDLMGKEFPKPEHVLFNGGSLKPVIVQERVRTCIKHWFKEQEEQKQEQETSDFPTILENNEPFLAVALGASYYGLVKLGHGVRVGSGSARSYYLGVDTDQGKRAICVIEHGLDEGSKIELTDKQFDVLANQPVSFDIYSSSFRSRDKSGDLIIIDETLTSLPPLQTIIQFGKKVGQVRLSVRVDAQYTEMGTLAIWCQSLTSDHRWRLQFELRQKANAEPFKNSEVFEESIVREVISVVKDTFSTDGVQEQFARRITDIVKRQKEKWPLSLLRSIADELIDTQQPARKTNANFEALWLNMTGFCIRPGFGEALDNHRVGNIWKLFKQGLFFDKSPQVQSEWWILWRRVAGGLSSGQQRQFVQDIKYLIKDKKSSQSKKISSQEWLELWMAIANMERVPTQDKIDLGKMLITDMSPNKVKQQHWWALSRIGARELLYGSIDRVIPSDEVTKWIKQILATQWRNPKPVATALVQLARKTGDRKRDIDDSTVQSILKWLKSQEISGINIKPLQEISTFSEQDNSVIFGESLPPGLVLH